MSEASPRWGGDGKLRIAVHAFMWCIYNVSYVHNSESTWTILWARLKKGNGRLGKPDIDTLD